ncbi:MAG: DUF5615 family PIN-like protein [Bacteroidota bacterium]
MTILVDAQLSPHLAPWITRTFSIEAFSVGYLGYRDAADTEIFEYARTAGAIVMTKDDDFVRLHYQQGSPPKIIWLTCGNTSNDHIKKILRNKLPQVLEMLNTSDLVELTD